MTERKKVFANDDHAHNMQCAARPPPTVNRAPTVWVLCTQPIDTVEYVRYVCALVGEQFYPPVRAKDNTKYSIKNRELGRC